MRTRQGFTVIEMAIVTTMIGLVTAMAFPKLAAVREQSALHSAKRHLLTQIAAARSSAIQRGGEVRLRTASNAVWLTTEIGGAQTEISPTSELGVTFDVTLSPSQDPVRFDSRGYAIALPATGVKYVLERGAQRDSVCLTRLGTILSECAS